MRLNDPSTESSCFTRKQMSFRPAIAPKSQKTHLPGREKLRSGRNFRKSFYEFFIGKAAGDDSRRRSREGAKVPKAFSWELSRKKLAISRSFHHAPVINRGNQSKVNRNKETENVSACRAAHTARITLFFCAICRA